MTAFGGYWSEFRPSEQGFSFRLLPPGQRVFPYRDLNIQGLGDR